ncbi:DUF3600 domain-containing protein [Gracilibacillus sp. S3-1-1]|uniref:DUF3600 domain-containing protein n=1 Tax=Gracilibacillus pellucidus TaxID=3095368 RepID=A0ACC6M7H3_9BACI|nr:DUF3600 domain-containing protein [Gracilibacillus sp. S3-1-1]MDX8046826.1 DUF3600 domain-containing protein [Gracilibacillus sp. S3-1-1]
MMNNDLKQALINIEIPDELHERSKNGVKSAKAEMEGKIKRYVRKRLIAGAIAVSLFIPTGAFAYQTLLADDFYGSFENLQKHMAVITMEGYMLLDAKLTQAKGELGKEEYTDFKELLNVITTSKLEYGNKHGYIDYSQIPGEQQTKLEEVLFEIQPYFDKLNGQESSEKVLTNSEYEEYISALMTHEQIMAQSGITNSSEMDKVPEQLQEEFTKAKNILMYVNDKQISNN